VLGCCWLFIALIWPRKDGVKALGRGYLDLFGQPAVELVDQGLESQVRGGTESLLSC
jgi:hypothetical protein